MEMTYGGALVMPSSYAMMDEEEMMYLEGGDTLYKYGSANYIRSYLDKIIFASYIGVAAMMGVGAIIGLVGQLKGAVIGGIIGFALGEAWLGKIRDCASNAHAQVERIIQKNGTNTYCRMSSTWSTIFMTSMSVKII